MAGLTTTEAQAALDHLFPTTGASDFIAYSTDGTTEFAGLARTAIGATGWSAATAADPSVKSNGSTLTTAAATAGGTVTHFRVMTESSGGSARTDWTALASSRVFGIGDTAEWAADALKVTLT